jgi:hypothetical protein
MKTPLEQMRDVLRRYGDDEEVGHAKGDELLCRLVRKYVPNGAAVVKEYENLDKWYG